jgi:hypothetical protein
MVSMLRFPAHFDALVTADACPSLNSDANDAGPKIVNAGVSE